MCALGTCYCCLPVVIPLVVKHCCIIPGEWSSPDIIGQPPSPSSHFSLTSFSERRAALFGGMSGSIGNNNLMIVDLGKHAVVSAILCKIIDI